MRKWTRALALLLAAVLALSLGACGKKADEKVLNVFTWAKMCIRDRCGRARC